MVELDNCIIIIKMYHHKYANNVEKYHIVMKLQKQLEKLVNSVRNAITEITVINYIEKVS